MQFTKDIILLDLEATVGDTTRGDICEIGAVYCCRKSLFILDEFSSLVKPIRDYRDPYAMQVHGIPEEELQKAPHLIIVLDDFENWILKNVCKQKLGMNLRNVMLSAWGVGFDLTLLQNQYKLLNRKYPFHYRSFDIKSVVYWYFAKMEKGISKKSGLTSVSKTLQIPFAGVHHKALDDAKQSLRILQCLALKKS